MILPAAMIAAFFEVGAQTPPLPPVPPSPPTPAPTPVAPVPRVPSVGDPITPRPPRVRDALPGLLDFDHRLEMERALEMARLHQDELRLHQEDMRLAQTELRRQLEREGREDFRRTLEDARHQMEEARRMAELELHGFRDRPTPFPHLAPLPPMPPTPAVPPMALEEALRALESVPSPAPRAQRMIEELGGTTQRPPEPWAPQDPGDSLYRAGRDLLNRGQYRSAAETFRLLSQKYPTSAYTPDVMYYEAYSLYRIGGENELRAALSVLDRQKTRFPNQSNPDPALPTRIRGALASGGDQRAADQVARTAAQPGQACNRDDMTVRIEALNALSRMNIDSTAQILRRVLSRRDECSVTLRRQAITLFAKRTDAATTDIMIDVLKNDPSPQVRQAAISWLGEVPSEKGSAALDEILRSPKDEQLHSAALRALSSSGNPRGGQALRSIIERKDVSENLRREAMSALTRVDSAGAGAYLRSVYSKLESRRLKEGALTVIGRSRDQETQRWMLAFVRDTTEPVEVRRAALGALTRSTTSTVAEIGALYRNVPEFELRQHIISTLANRKEPEAVDQLISIYRASTDTKLKVQIISLLTRREDPRTQKLLIDILDGSPPSPSTNRPPGRS
jgi:HEAT repeat protein/TolA-binding protein